MAYPKWNLVAALIASLSFATPATAQSVQYRSDTDVEYRSLPDTGPVARAQTALAADPRNVQLIIQLGVAQSGARQFREAIETFTRGLKIAPNDAMLYRWRGHRYLSVRDFYRAISDLTRGLRLDSTNYGILYHKGIVEYGFGDFAGAARTFARAQPRAPDAGELAGATDWLWMSLSRAGKPAEAKAMLDRRPDSLPTTNAYARRLKLYRGEIAPDEVLTAADTGDVAVATLSYGLGNWYLLRGDTANARGWFERSIVAGGWPAFGFIMSEIELRRLRYASTRFNYDSLAALVARLEPLLMPLVRARDSMVNVIRAESATLRADSAYWRFRSSLSSRVESARRTFDGPAFQVVVNSDGAAFQQRNRRIGLPPFDRADALDKLIADSIRRVLRAHGIWMYIGEGDAYFEMDETALMRTFGPFLTAAGREASRLITLEQATPTAEDASIQVSTEKLSERVATTDVFLEKYPDALGSDQIRERHRIYLGLYLRGSDNSEAFHRRTGILLPELRQSLERYVAKYGTTSSGQIVAKYLAVLKANNYVRNAAVQEFLRQYVEWHPR